MKLRNRQWHHSGVFTANFEQIAHLVVVFLLLALGRSSYTLISFFKPKNIFLTSTNVIFNIITYTRSFCTFNKKKTPKIGIQETNLYIFQ